MSRAYSRDTPSDIYYPYLNQQASPDGVFAVRKAAFTSDGTQWQSNPWMRERERLANGLPVPGINYPLHTEFMMKYNKNPDAIIYESPHCGCVDCNQGAVDLSKGADCRELARHADLYGGQYGPDLASIYGSDAIGASNSPRNKTHSRVFNGSESGRLVPNWNNNLHDSRVTGRYLASSGRQLPPVDFGQPVPFVDELGNRNILLMKIPNTGRSRDQFEFEEQTGYSPNYHRVMAPPALREANMRECASYNPVHCAGGYKHYGYVPGAHANSNILAYKPCLEFLNNCRQ